MKNFVEVNPKEFEESVFKLIGDDWMLITAKKDSKANAMTASWGGMGVLWNKNVVYTVLRPQRYTKEFVDKSDTFSLCFFDKKYKKQLSYLGTVSGRDEDKMSKVELTLNSYNDTPYFEEAEIIIFCKKLYAQELNSESFINKQLIGEYYPENDFHTLYISEIEKIMIRN